MTLLPTPAPRTERMTRRARAYVAIAAARHLALGLVALVLPATFSSPSYDGIKHAVPFAPDHLEMVAWGVVLLFVGLLCLRPVLTGSDRQARLALLASVVTSGAWVGGFIAAHVTGHSAGPSGVIIWTALVAKDLTMLRDPLRNPFEDFATEVAPRPIGG